MKTAFMMGAAAGFVLGACLVRKCKVVDDVMQTAEDKLMETANHCKQKMQQAKMDKQAQEEYAQMYDFPDTGMENADNYAQPQEMPEMPEMI